MHPNALIVDLHDVEYRHQMPVERTADMDFNAPDLIFIQTVQGSRLYATQVFDGKALLKEEKRIIQSEEANPRRSGPVKQIVQVNRRTGEYKVQSEVALLDKQLDCGPALWSCFNGCGAKEETPRQFRKCGRCLYAVYCGVECQKVHWKREHKAFCGKQEKKSTKVASTEQPITEQ